MNCSSLEKWQAAAIRDALFPSTNYLIRLRRRMEETGFAHDDELYRQACTAHDAINRLRMSAHYLACGGAGSPKGFGQA
jgi:hypothetical protein